MSLLVFNPSLHHLSPPHLVACRFCKAMLLYPKRASLLCMDYYTAFLESIKIRL